MKNIFIFVSDALRYDHLPDSVASEGTVLKTLAPSLHTPVSFPSIITGRSPENHNVRGFNTTLNSDYKTVFDRFESEKASYYDHPEDAMRKNVFENLPSSKEIEDLEEPFIQVERAMETHTPYNEMHHGNELRRVPDGDYTRSFESDKKLKEKYEEGVKGAEEHFWEHVKKLEEKGLREDTLIIFTSDHGELLGEKINFRKRYAHGNPPIKNLVQVPTVFLDHEFEEEYIRSIDIVETALNMIGKDGLDQDGVDFRTSERKRSGRVIIDGYARYDHKWEFKNNDWYPKSKFKVRKDILKNDFRIASQKIRDKVDSYREENKENVETEELEDIDI